MTGERDARQRIARIHQGKLPGGDKEGAEIDCFHRAREGWGERKVEQGEYRREVTRGSKGPG